jgi:hypothetical protein
VLRVEPQDASLTGRTAILTCFSGESSSYWQLISALRRERDAL